MRRHICAAVELVAIVGGVMAIARGDAQLTWAFFTSAWIAYLQGRISDLEARHGR